MPEFVYFDQIPLIGIGPFLGSDLPVFLILDMDPFFRWAFFAEKLRQEALSMDALDWLRGGGKVKERGQEIRQLHEVVAPRSGFDRLRPADD